MPESARPPAAYIGSPAEGVVSAAPTTAGRVLQHHMDLHDLLAHPNPATSSIVRVPVGSLCRCPCDESTLRLIKACICPDCPCEDDSDHAEPDDECEGAP